MSSLRLWEVAVKVHQWITLSRHHAERASVSRPQMGSLAKTKEALGSFLVGRSVEWITVVTLFAMMMTM